MTSTRSNRKYKAPIEGCISCWFNDRLDLYQVWYRITRGFMFGGIVWICAHSELSRRPIILIELACVFFQYVSILFPGISLPALWINESTTIYVIKICKCTCIVGSTFNRRTISARWQLVNRKFTFCLAFNARIASLCGKACAYGSFIIARWAWLSD